MRALTSAELLEAWERGQGQPAAEWAVDLLAAACPGAEPASVASWSIGRRDAGLLTLRERTFGPHLACAVTCPACAESLELAFDAADIRTARPESVGGAAETLSVSLAGYEVDFRLPNSLDLLADPAGLSRLGLLKRCVVAARRGGESAAVEALPPAVVEAVETGMAEADPQADPRLALDCPSCGHAWQAPFDVLSFFRAELNAWAARLLWEVHRLAAAYGWREADVLALSPNRRRFYLEAVAR